MITQVSPGQIEISCNFIANRSLVLGHMAIVYSGDNDVNYLITENLNHGYTNNTLTGLRNKQYSILLYAIGENGLPSKQAAGFPKEQSILATNHEVGKSSVYPIIY